MKIVYNYKPVKVACRSCGDYNLLMCNGRDTEAIGPCNDCSVCDDFGYETLYEKYKL